MAAPAPTQERLLKNGRDLAGRLRRGSHRLCEAANADSAKAQHASQACLDVTTVRMLVDALEDGLAEGAKRPPLPVLWTTSHPRCAE